MIIDKELEFQLKRDVFKASYFEFFKWSFNLLFPNEKYEDAFHIKFLCDTYQAEVERIIRREEKGKDLIVNIPPRTSKSLVTSVCLLAWVWIIDPTIPMISVSFDEELTLLNAQYCKDIIKSDEYQALFGDLFQIRHDADSKGYFMNDKGGFRLSKTTGANITGHKGMIMVVDDPQNPKKAESELHRKDTIDYYTKSFYNRLTPANLGIRIIIMQRLHEEDLTGYLLKKSKEDYRHICLPAESQRETIDEHGNKKITNFEVKPAELRARYKDFLLDGIRLGRKILNGFRKVLGSRGYSGQYEQKPAPDEGGILKKVWFLEVDPATLKRDVINEPIHFFIDGAYTEKTENDPTAIFTCYASGNHLYVLDVQEVWLEFPALIKFITQHVHNFQHNAGSCIYIEPKASGKSIAQQLRSITMLNVVELEAPKDDKITRAHGIAPICESLRVKTVSGPYREHFVDQLGMFPGATHDDMVDCLVMATNTLLVNNSPDFFFA